MTEETNRELKDLVIRECEKIPSNNNIFYNSAEVSHDVIERKSGEIPLEKHIIKIEWVQIQDKAEKE